MSKDRQRQLLLLILVVEENAIVVVVRNRLDEGDDCCCCCCWRRLVDVVSPPLFSVSVDLFTEAHTHRQTDGQTGTLCFFFFKKVYQHKVVVSCFVPSKSLSYNLTSSSISSRLHCCLVSLFWGGLPPPPNQTHTQTLVVAWLGLLKTLHRNTHSHTQTDSSSLFLTVRRGKREKRGRKR